ncbi:MAG: hypothetical protein MJ014_00205 [Methanocorpusculum sp.]|nr:hypothetical protein [Methanocorpusculum sp.]
MTGDFDHENSNHRLIWQWMSGNALLADETFPKLNLCLNERAYWKRRLYKAEHPRVIPVPCRDYLYEIGLVTPGHLVCDQLTGRDRWGGQHYTWQDEGVRDWILAGETDEWTYAALSAWFDDASIRAFLRRREYIAAMELEHLMRMLGRGKAGEIDLRKQIERMRERLDAFKRDDPFLHQKSPVLE